MTSCREIYAFLSQVTAKKVGTPPSDADATFLSDNGLVQFVSAEQYRSLETSVQNLNSAREAVDQDAWKRAGLAQEAADEARQTHSVLFRLESKGKRAAKVQQEANTDAQLRAVDQDLASKQQQYGQLVSQQSLLDTLTPCADRYVALTSLGAVEMRDLGVRLYRASDADFRVYWQQAHMITQELTDLAAKGADFASRLAVGIDGADRSLLWAISIGLAKSQPDAAQGSAAFVHAYDIISALSNNIENRLMSTEILLALPRPVEEELAQLTPLLHEVARLKIPSQSALGIASILLLGQRADGTIATDNLAQYLRVTQSYESAALLAIVNLPVDELARKFQGLRTMFGGWGYQPSEDVELSSAYLAVSELPADGISTKLAIIAKGLSTYLQYPLVAAAVLTALSTLEANETLNLLEHAYDIVGRRTGPMSQAELICLAVRMLHGIRDELVRPLDATATVPVTPGPPVGPGIYGPRFYFVPIIVAHNAYFATYSGIGGVHPGHVHGFGGGGGGFTG